MKRRMDTSNTIVIRTTGNSTSINRRSFKRIMIRSERSNRHAYTHRVGSPAVQSEYQFLTTAGKFMLEIPRSSNSVPFHGFCHLKWILLFRVSTNYYRCENLTNRSNTFNKQRIRYSNLTKCLRGVILNY